MGRMRKSIHEILSTYDIKEFPYLSVTDQSTCQLECKKIFKEFRSNFFSKTTIKGNIKNKQFTIDRGDVQNASQLLRDMNTMLSFEGRPPTEKDNHKLRNMMVDLKEDIDQFEKNKSLA